MLNKLRSNKGFTLIELLIVVAIIGILAAIAIPQFSQYRVRGYNSAALSDLNNVKLAENGFNNDSGGVFASTAGIKADGTGGTGAAGVGALVFGPQNITVSVAANSINNFPATAQTFRFGVSNGVIVDVNSTDTTAAEYVVGAAHTQGSEIYLFDSDTTANRKVVAGKATGTQLKTTDVPASTTATDDLAGATYATI